MRPKSLALLLLALGCGLVASIGITKVMTRGNGDGDGAIAEGAGIYVAAADIPMGDRLTPRAVKLRAVAEGHSARRRDLADRGY